MKKFRIPAAVLIFALFAYFNITATTTQNGNDNNCMKPGCHSDMKKTFMHKPMDSDCGSCHDFKSGSHPGDPGEEYMLTKSVPDLCSGCHDIKKQNKSEHAPFMNGECLTCHNPHGSNTKGLLKQNDGKVICTLCHEFSGAGVNMHRPAEKGECIKCHEPHGSAQDNLLKSDEKSLCYTCHNRALKSGTNSVANIKQKAGMKFVHEPVLKQECSLCHDPHASVNEKLLIFVYQNNTYVYQKEKSVALCFSCHSEDIISDKPKATLFSNGRINLHYVHVNRDKSRNCNICHDSHGSNEQYLINQSVQFNKWMLPINFTKTENGGKCASGCHKPLTYERTLDMQKQMVEAKPGVIEQDTTGQLHCEVVLNQGYDQRVIKKLTFYLNRADTLYTQTIELKKRMNFTVRNLNRGDYVLSVDKKDLESMDASTSTPVQKFRISGSSLINNANLKFFITIKEKNIKK